MNKNSSIPKVILRATRLSIWSLASGLIVAAPPNAIADVNLAAKLYSQAQYEQSLEALNDDCRLEEPYVECEMLKAFIHMARGERELALMAYGRLLSEKPTLDLPNDVAPKIRALFDEAKEKSAALLELSLTSPAEVQDQTVTLELMQPPSNPFDSIAVWISPPSRHRYEQVELEFQGEFWNGLWLADADSDLPPTLNYYLKLRAAGGNEFNVGSADHPLDLKLKPSLQSTATTTSATSTLLPNDLVEAWPWWTPWAIGGGAAIIVGGVVLTALLLTQEEQPGGLTLNFDFGEP
jgi:hypothetical protein